MAQKAALVAAEQALAEARDVTAAERARCALALAKKSLKAAEADLASVDARIAADTARYAQPPLPDAVGQEPDRRPPRPQAGGCSKPRPPLLRGRTGTTSRPRRDGQATGRAPRASRP